MKVKKDSAISVESEKKDDAEHTYEALYLYNEDMKNVPRTVTFLHSNINCRKSRRQSSKKMGTLLGVYIPTIQHIMGLLMFIRHHWVVGHCGLLEGVSMVLLCSATTFFTAISVSAISTNGILESGGSYYLLSRNLGPECGGSIGICFYLANTFATCLYLLGSIELLLVFMVPEMAIFGDIHHDPWNNFRIYGTGLLLFLTLVVALGVKIVSLFAPFSLFCVIISILSIFIGAFVPNRDTKVCMVGEKLMFYPRDWIEMNPNNLSDPATQWCTKNQSTYLESKLCEEVNNQTVCDPYYLNNEVKLVHAIPGVTSDTAKKNFFEHYLEEGEVSKGIPGSREKGEVTNDFSTGFIVLCAIYFPSLTGILTGVNMSGDLKNPRKSIPKGTIFAQLTCSFIFLIMMVLYGITIRGEVLRDKLGESLGGELISALLCWPNKWVVLVGAFSSSIGAGLQCLVSAARLLQSIAVDDIIPFLGFFKKLTKKGEPIRALVITFFIAEIGIIIANIDAVAPIIDVAFLMCYLFVNLICVIQTILKLPNWRPKFKYYHWTFSLLGAALNLILSFIAGWYFALAAFLVAAFIYLYIMFKGSEKEWGDGIKGLLMTFTEWALHNLEDEPHMRNWRPQILVLGIFDEETKELLHPELLNFISQLKHSRGLTILATVVQGDPAIEYEKIDLVKEKLTEDLALMKIRGFVKVVKSDRIVEGAMLMVQSLGMGCLSHNTVMLSWPTKGVFQDQNAFIHSIITTYNTKNALLILKTLDYPFSTEKLSGTIDIWWIIHDGGMLILLAFMLKMDRVWRDCKIRIFTMAIENDNSQLIKQHLERYLYQIRIDAEVFVVEMKKNDLLAFETDRQIDKETRVQYMRQAAERNNSQINKADIVGMLRTMRNSITPANSSQTRKISNKEENHENLETPITDVNQILRRQNAIQFNTVIKERSIDAQLIILNLPVPPALLGAEENYVTYLELMTDQLKRVLFVRGTGKEIVSLYS